MTDHERAVRASPAKRCKIEHELEGIQSWMAGDAANVEVEAVYTNVYPQPEACPRQ
ncbi:hypothetical protein ACLI4Q_12815 [Natrialbaceae archaeon A-CW1-1]